MYLNLEQYKAIPVEVKPVEEWRRILLEVADIIEKRGWWKGSYCKSVAKRDTSPVCVLGAFNVAMTDNPTLPDYDEDTIRAEAALCEYLVENKVVNPSIVSSSMYSSCPPME